MIMLMVVILLGFMIDFEKLSEQNIETIIVTGTREELQLRLKLAEVNVPIILEKDIYKATAMTMNYEGFTVAILTTHLYLQC